jgi:hypothetical protein
MFRPSKKYPSLETIPLTEDLPLCENSLFFLWRAWRKILFGGEKYLR